MQIELSPVVIGPYRRQTLRLLQISYPDNYDDLIAN